MKITLYKRYDGIQKTQLPQGDWVEEYQTSQVTIRWPAVVEKVFRYLRMYHPQCKYLLDWNPAPPKSFGHRLEFSDDLQTVTLRSQTAAFLRAGDAEIIWPIQTRFQQHVALRGIADYFTWYAKVCEEQKPQHK